MFGACIAGANISAPAYRMPTVLLNILFNTSPWRVLLFSVLTAITALGLARYSPGLKQPG
jgi:hypothetical protein